MTTKLTLTIDKKIISKAKQYAKSEGRSLSNLIENYLKAIIAKEDDPTYEVSYNIDSMRGSMKPPEHFDYKEILREELTKKHLK